MQGLTQVDLAKKMGISKQTVNQLLTGEHSPRLSTLELMAEALGKTVSEMLFTDQEKQIWEAGKKSKPSIKAEIVALMDGLDEVKLKFLKASAEGIAAYGNGSEMVPKKLKKLP